MKLLFLANSHDSMLAGLDFARTLKLPRGDYGILLTQHNVLSRAYIADAAMAGVRIFTACPPRRYPFMQLHYKEVSDTDVTLQEVVTPYQTPHRPQSQAAERNSFMPLNAMRTLKRSIISLSRRIEEILFVISFARMFEPDIVGMRYCMAGSHNVIWAKLGRFLGYKSVAYTNTHTKSGKSLVPNALANNERHHVTSSASRLFAVLFSHWATTWQGRRLLRLPLVAAATDQLLGLTLKDPWAPLNAPPLDAVLVESEVIAKSLTSEGVPAARVHVVGSYALDRMAEIRASRTERRRHLLQQGNMKDDRPLMLCALPPSERFPTRSLPDLPTIDALVELWFSNLARLDTWNIVITPHPRLNLKALSLDYPRTLTSNLRALELLPLCDCFLTAASTTLRWAKACGVPTINFDCFATGLEQEGTGLGHHYTSDRLELMEIFDRLSVPANLATAKKLATSGHSQWGVMDGTSPSKALGACCELLN